MPQYSQSFERISNLSRQIVYLLNDATPEESLLALTFVSDIIKSQENSPETMKARIASQLGSLGISVVGAPQAEDPRKKNPMPDWLQKLADGKDDDDKA